MNRWSQMLLWVLALGIAFAYWLLNHSRWAQPDRQHRPTIHLPPVTPSSAVAVHVDDVGVNSLRVEWTSKGETECARVLRVLFPSHSFSKVRPNWLMNNYPGRRTPPRPLELDLYCPELKLAVEYNGQQHYAIVPIFHGVGEDAPRKLYAQQQKDLKKKQLCAAVGVDLIIVRFDEPDIELFLRRHEIVRQRLYPILLRERS